MVTLVKTSNSMHDDNFEYLLRTAAWSADRRRKNEDGKDSACYEELSEISRNE